jgi:hypothetical protein
VDDLYYAQQLLDETFAGSGLRAGVDFLDNTYGAYDTMKAVWKEAGVYPPDEGDIAYQYNDWLLSNAISTDPSVSAFIDQRQSTSESTTTAPIKRETVTPRMIAEQRGVSLDVVDASVPRTASGALDTSQMQRVTPNQEFPLSTGPSMEAAAPLVLYPGISLRMVRMSEDGQWAYVVAPGDQLGWVPTVALNTA